MTRIKECLDDHFRHEYIFPFFWQHGGSHEIMSKELDAMEDCGIKEFCIESRIHANFCREQWWDDMGFLLSEAKRREMRVWLLDDKQFPTGYADNYINRRKELRRKTIVTYYRDIVNTGDPFAIIPPDEVRCSPSRCISARAYRRIDSNGRLLEDESYDLTPSIVSEIIHCQLPKGYFRIHYICLADVSSTDKPNYIDMLSEESCRAMIYAVYEPHYRHFGQYFGTVFKGFFSDEPSFSNETATYYSMLGKEDMPIPWNDSLPDLIAADAGITVERVIELLPALWHEIKGQTALIRQCYMDAITKLYSKNFTSQLASWCHEHGVMYTGHVIEDMNTHQRLGYGSGHYFRATAEQDVAGIDVVLHQILPGFTDAVHTMPVCGKLGDPEFFEYLLGKLCISQAQLTEHMKGRAMCEIFGAYGWAEGVPTMKQIADSMLVNGINRFVPHAFDTIYPNPDCPPHFYIGGRNPQFVGFKQLMQYMQRASHLLDGGIHNADIALFYNAEGEWNGGKNMLTQHPAKLLTRAHADFEIVWEDLLYSGHAENGCAVLGGKIFRLILVPYAEILPEKLLRALNRYAENSVPVLFIGEKPEQTSEGGDADKLICACGKLAEDSLAEYVKEKRLCGIITDEEHPLLRYYSYSTVDGRVWMVKNDDIFCEADFFADLGEHKELRIYDCWSNRLYLPEMQGNRIRIRLSKGGSCFIVESSETAAPMLYPNDSGKRVHLNATVSVCPVGEDVFTPVPGCPGDITSIKGYESFCGRIRYEGSFDSDGATDLISLGRIGEIATVWLNGIELGISVSDPCLFTIYGVEKAGVNRLTIEIINNPAYRDRDFFSTYMTLPASGFGGEITLFKRDNGGKL